MDPGGLKSPPGAQTRIVLFRDDAHKPSFGPCVFTCEDIAQTHREMVEKGVEFTQAPKVEAWGAWWAQFKDSEGNEFGLSQASGI
ncbi:VOC family protein [Paenarthrobacter sp. PH39-S1]|uniref:VOC family protein n=1 Tax=Paenarthrobacter sp. PH39-S1 TaxID=3046204 RepID=UPI0032D998A5